MVSLASLAGERLFFSGDSSSGVSGDLESATTIAELMEGQWGMGSTIASHSARRSPGTWPPNQPEGEMLRGAMGERVEARLRELLGRTDKLLEENRAAVFAVAHALESHRTLSGEDVEAVIEGRQGRTVDGTVYLAPRFLETFGAYHDDVVDAHLNRAKLASTLPQPADWAPELIDRIRS